MSVAGALLLTTIGDPGAEKGVAGAETGVPGCDSSPEEEAAPEDLGDGRRSGAAGSAPPSAGAAAGTTAGAAGVAAAATSSSIPAGASVAAAAVSGALSSAAAEGFASATARLMATSEADAAVAEVDGKRHLDLNTRVTPQHDLTAEQIYRGLDKGFPGTNAPWPSTKNRKTSR